MDVVAAPRRLSRERRREQLLDVTADLLVEGGIEAVTMEGVAARAGVSKGLGYAYFTNRDELLATLYDRELGALDRAVLRAGAQADGSFAERLEHILTAAFGVIAERGALIGALLQGKRDDGPLEDRRRRRQAAVEGYFVDLVVSEFGLADRAAQAAVAFLLGAYSGALDLWVARRASRKEMIPAFVRFAVAGLEALASTATG